MSDLPPEWPEFIRRNPRRFGMFIALPIAVVSVIVFFQLIADGFGYRFLPSPMWVDAVRPLGAPLTFFLAIIALVFIFTAQDFPAFGHPASRGLPHGFPKGTVMRGIMVLFGPLLFWFIFFGFLIQSVPTLLAISSSKRVEFIFEVSKPPAFSDRRCRQKVELKDRPFMAINANNLCGVPQSLRERLVPGDRIGVRGYGNQFGVFYDEFFVPD